MIPATIPNEDLIGRRVEISDIRSMLYCKKGTISYILSSGNANIQVRLDGETGTTFWGRDELTLLTDAWKAKSQGSKDGCECGSSAVGSPRHSYYCKLYKDWEDVK
jgi:hypothetical protein